MAEITKLSVGKALEKLRTNDVPVEDCPTRREK